MEATSIFQPEKLHRKSKWKQRGFPNNRNYIKKRTWKKCGYFDQRNYIKKVCGKNVDFSTSKIAAKKNTSKRLGNSSEFGFGPIDVDSA